MKKGWIMLLLLSLVCLTAVGGALADPVLTRDGKVIWLGEENFLYLQDETGALKQLPAAIKNF